MTKEQTIEELRRSNAYLEGQVNKLEKQVEKFEEANKYKFDNLNRMSEERETNIRMLMDVITMLVAPEIIKDQNKQGQERIRMRNNY